MPRHSICLTEIGLMFILDMLDLSLDVPFSAFQIDLPQSRIMHSILVSAPELGIHGCGFGK